MPMAGLNMATPINPSDLRGKRGDTPKKPYRQILIDEMTEGLHAMQRSVTGLSLSGLSAGLDIGFSLFLMAAMQTLAGEYFSQPVLRMVNANLYAVGFIFVVLGRSELFTEQTTLAVLPVLGRHASLARLGRLWAIIYVSNLVGAALFAELTVLIGPRLQIIDVAALGEISATVTEHPALAILLSAVLAGWLMGLMSWLVAASRDTISQIVVVWLVATVIGFTQLHHAIVGSVEVLAGVFAGRATLASFGHFLLWATIGNAIGGGVFVAVLKYSHATREEPEDVG